MLFYNGTLSPESFGKQAATADLNSDGMIVLRPDQMPRRIVTNHSEPQIVARKVTA
jgi:hypothetical protein